jgi:hypothetical protein
VTPWSFADYARSAAGEFTVAKPIYTDLPSGWFSDRSACFLATGRPVVTQGTGFEHWLETGRGLLAYQTADEAAAALETIHQDPAKHAMGARRLAEQHFDSARVLRELLGRVL